MTRSAGMRIAVAGRFTSVAGSEVDGPQRARDARWMAKKLLAG